MSGLEMDRNADLNLSHDKLSYLKQYKRINMCHCGVDEVQIILEHHQGWDVKGLPENWVPNTAPSAIIQRLQGLREERHNALISEMHMDMINCSESISNKIRAACDEFRLELEACCVAVKSESERLGRLTHSEFFEQCYRSWENVVKALRNINTTLNEFYVKLDEFECERSEKYKHILSISSDKMWKNAHITPFKVQEYFETLILKVNQNLLGNASARVDLYNHLHYIIFLVGCDYQKESSRTRRELDAKENKRKLMAEHERLMSVYGEEGGEAVEDVDWVAWVKQLEGYVSGMADILKDSIRRVFRIHQVGKMPMLSILNINPELCFRGSVLSNRSFSESYQDVNMSNIDKCLAEVRQFIDDAFKIWNDHAENNSEKKEKIQQDLDKIFASFDKVYQQRLKKILPMLSLLRNESGIKKLNKNFKKTRRAIVALDKICDIEYENELKIIHSYDDFMDYTIDCIIEESSQLLRNHKHDNKEPRFNKNFPVHLHGFQYKVICLVHWKQGLYSAIKKFTRSDKSLLKQWAREFTYPLLEEARMRMESYRSYLRVLRLDLEADLDIRRYELKLHAGRLKEHMKAIKVNIKDMKKRLKKTPASGKPAFKQNFLSDLQSLHEATEKFNKDLVCFESGGNYTKAESKKMEKGLSKTEKIIIKERKLLDRNHTKAESKKMKKGSTKIGKRN